MLMFNPFAPNRTRGRFAFSWDVVVHTATWLNAICATGPQPPPRCLSNLRILRSYIPTRSSVSGVSYTFLPIAFHPPTLAPPVVCLLVACQNVLQALSMPFVYSRCCWKQSQVLCDWLPLPSWGGCLAQRESQALARALLDRAPFRTAWHSDLSTMNSGMGKDGNRTSWGRGYVFTRVAHSSQPPTGGHLRSRVSSTNFTSTLS